MKSGNKIKKSNAEFNKILKLTLKQSIGLQSVGTTIFIFMIK